MQYKNVAKEELFNLYYDLKKSSLFKDHILGGGTALALQLGHRTSTDIDLFTTNEIDNKDILNELNKKYGSYYIQTLNDFLLRVEIKNILVDFIKENRNILEMPKIENNITYFGVKDISAMKLRTILTRNKPRDYIDIAYILKDLSLDEMAENYKDKYKANDMPIIKIALMRSKFFTKDEWYDGINMLKNDIKLENIPKILENEIGKYNKKHNIGNINNENIINIIKNKMKNIGRRK